MFTQIRNKINNATSDHPRIAAAIILGCVAATGYLGYESYTAILAENIAATVFSIVGAAAAATASVSLSNTLVNEARHREGMARVRGQINEGAIRRDLRRMQQVQVAPQDLEEGKKQTHEESATQPSVLRPKPRAGSIEINPLVRYSSLDQQK